MGEECPICKRKSLRHRAIYDNYYCDRCRKLFDENKKELQIDFDCSPLQVSKDKNGNYFDTKTEIKEDKIYYTKVYYLEKGKTTLRGEHKKLKDDKDCKYPERLTCNSDIGCDRCEFMEYGGTLGYWICKYKKK